MVSYYYDAAMFSPNIYPVCSGAQIVGEVEWIFLGRQWDQQKNT